MSFSSWVILLILLVIPVLHRWWYKRNTPASVRYSRRVPSTAGISNPIWKLMTLRYFAIAMIVMALARPQSSYVQTERKVSGVDIVMVMDVSRSMDIEDLGGEARIDVAKRTMKTFVEGRGNDRIGFVMFSGEAVTMAPPTLDYGLMFRIIAEARTGRLKDGTAIGDGLSVGVNRLRESDAKSKVIILLTDGENNVGKVDPVTAGELAAGYGIKVYSIAIGTEGEVNLPIRYKDVFGKTTTRYQKFENQLNTTLLEEISKTTGARFYRVTEAATLESVFSEIDQLERSEVKTNKRIRYSEKFEQPLALGFLFLLLEQVLCLLWWRMVP